MFLERCNGETRLQPRAIGLGIFIVNIITVFEEIIKENLTKIKIVKK
jgi:hypothetical protein